MVIHHPPRKVTKVSCQMCHWYCIDDHSCASKGLARTDKIDHWKKCEDFILDPDYLWFDVKKRIKEVRGQKFLKEMLEKSKSFIVDPDEYIKPKSPKEEPMEEEASTDPKIENEKTEIIELEGEIYLYKNQKRCVIADQDKKYFYIKFESGKEVKFDRKTIITKHLLKKV